MGWVLCGVEFQVCFVWSVECGVWRVVRRVAYGVLCVVCGVWYGVCDVDVFCMVCGM